MVSTTVRVVALRRPERCGSPQAQKGCQGADQQAENRRLDQPCHEVLHLEYVERVLNRI